MASGSRRQTARELGLGRNLIPGPHGGNVRCWTAEEDEAVRTLTPAGAAAQTGRTANAVYWRRCVLGVSRPRG